MGVHMRALDSYKRVFCYLLHRYRELFPILYISHPVPSVLLIGSPMFWDSSASQDRLLLLIACVLIMPFSSVAKES